jgi:DNA-directed DNA polymerase III PolC
MKQSIRVAHLQVHSHFTLLGGTATVEQLAARAAAEGMTHLALTDTNALYGAVAFARACRSAGIQSIVGMTVTTQAPDVRMGARVAPGRLVLLATGQAGYRSLCRLSSLIQAHPQRELRAARGLHWDELRKYHEGLVCLSGGRMGWIERYVRAGDHAAAARCAAQLVDIFGENAFLSLEVHHDADWGTARELVAVGQRVALRPVAVQPVYCLSPEDAPRLRLLAALDHNMLLEQVPPSVLPANGDPQAKLHWLSSDEIAARFVGFPEALATMEEVVERCEPALPDGRPIWATLSLPEGQTPDQALEILALAGLETQYSRGVQLEVRERLAGELAAIAGHGCAPLFLVVADIVRFARQASIPVNTRGSVANSLVAYCTGITNVDPIAHDLLFERFLNPARTDLPDIDLDFCSRRRDQVLDYVRRTYGPDHVALVSTMTTLRPRSAIRETAKAFGLEENETKRLVSLLPRGWHPDPRRRDRRTVEDVLDELEEERLRAVVRAAYSVVGQPHHLSVHPGGVVITSSPLTDVVPVQWTPKGFLITQFDHRDVEAVGLSKIDLLGIRALTVLAEAEHLVQRHYDPGFRQATIPPDDRRTADLLARAETIGVFQCESEGARRTLRQLRARTVRDLAVANAFFKPGPAMGGMAATFVRRYRGEEPVAYLHPSLAPILGNTHGVLLFQEQILRVARDIAGLTWEQADRLRRGMSHFGHQEMAELQAYFVAGCRRPQPEGPGLTAQQAETLWDQVLAFAGYGFNQGHATAYAEVSYRTAYMKTHWPAAFLCARLAERGGFHHPAVYMAEAGRLGLSVRPPHVNRSGRRFSLSWEGEQGILWMGLGQVRDLRLASIQAILEERRVKPFADLRDLVGRVALHSKEMTHLVQCGALDGLGTSRAAILAEADEIRQAGSGLQMTFDFARPRVTPEPAAQRLAWERQLLGQPVSVHPMELVADRRLDALPLRQLPSEPGLDVTVAAIRLPGWAGGKGFFLSDGDIFIMARSGKEQPLPRPWKPLLVRGRWLADGWGTFWLGVDGMSEIQEGN